MGVVLVGQFLLEFLFWTTSLICKYVATKVSKFILFFFILTMFKMWCRRISDLKGPDSQFPQLKNLTILQTLSVYLDYYYNFSFLLCYDVSKWNALRIKNMNKQFCFLSPATYIYILLDCFPEYWGVAILKEWFLNTLEMWLAYDHCKWCLIFFLYSFVNVQTFLGLFMNFKLFTYNCCTSYLFIMLFYCIVGIKHFCDSFFDTIIILF